MGSDKVLFIKRLFLTAITTLLTSVIGILVIPIFTKGKSIEDYGIWVQITTSLQLIPLLVSYNLPYSLIRYIAGEKNKEIIKEIVYSVIIFVLLSSIILNLPMAYFILKYTVSGNIGLLLPFYTLLILTCMINVGINYYRGAHQITYYSLYMIFQTILGILGIVYAVLNGWNIYLILLTQVFAYGLTFIIMLIHIIRDLGIHIPKFKYMIEMLKFSIPLLPSVLSWWIVSASDRYIIGYFLGITYVGYYTSAYMLASILNLLSAPLGILLPATLTKLYEERKIGEIKEYLKYIMKYYLIISIPMVFGISIFAKPLLAILSTGEIAEKSYLIIPIVAIGTLFYGLYVILYHIFIITKRTGISAKIWMVSAFINFILNIIFIPKYGIFGAAITTLIAYLVAFIVVWKYSLKILKFDFESNILPKSIISSIIMAVLLLRVKISGLSDLLLYAIVGALIYIICLISLKGFSEKEISIIKNVKNGILHKFRCCRKI